MSLLDKKSMYDRHVHGNLGNPVGNGFSGNNWASAGTSPSDGQWFANGNSGWTQSPFNSNTGDHMVDLMTSTVSTGGNTYLPSPTTSNFQDLNTTAVSCFSGQPNNPSLGQFGGPYIDNCPPGGFC
tara:strand:- start:2169 stop:2546 length:378 start_codon:yes stop_codon:yes gene_type:complete